MPNFPHNSFWLLRLIWIWPLAISQLVVAETRRLQDQEMATPIGRLRVTDLVLKTGRPIRLTGRIANDTPKAWDRLEIRINPADGKNTKITGSPLRLYDLKQGASAPFYFDLSGRVDFPSLSYAFSYLEGAYAPSYRFELLSPAASQELTFSDELTEWKFVPTTSTIGFEVKNKSDKTVKLDWNQASFVDATGQAHKIAGTGVRYIDMNSPRTPTVVPPGANIKDALFPIDYVRFSNQWNHEPIFPDCPACVALAGSEFTIFFPLDIGGTVREYIFRCRIKSVE